MILKYALSIKHKTSTFFIYVKGQIMIRLVTLRGLRSFCLGGNQQHEIIGKRLSQSYSWKRDLNQMMGQMAPKEQSVWDGER